MALPAFKVDGNTPGYWHNGRLRVFTSTGELVGMEGDDLFSLEVVDPPVVENANKYPRWIEGVWADEGDVVYAWYHEEPDAESICAGRKLTAPRIGALVSEDGGRTFRDLGYVITSGDPVACDAENGFFAGGHGDFSVILDRDRRYFYFLFTNYAGEGQGISIARMAFEDRANPAGMVFKFHQGEWTEPGIAGRVTPILKSTVPWTSANADSFWGPAVHWNHHLNRYVILLNRACCAPEWPQEGIYVTYTPDLADPASWKAPAKLMDAKEIGFAPGYYPQVWGIGDGEADSLAGFAGRFFVKGDSRWIIVFSPDPSNSN